MSKGALLFAFNTDTIDYFSMASYTAKRINHFLDLPVTVITDNIENSINSDYQFDNIIYTASDHSNFKDNKVWLNKGRYQAFDDSPYDETLLLDTDYIVNSNKLLSLFSFYDDFYCHNSTSYILNSNEPQETIGKHGFKSLWATVMLFKKTERVKQIFECMKMIQDNYEHYVKLYGMYKPMYRNDYSLSIAQHIVNGHIDVISDYIPWDLQHVDKNVTVKKNTDNFFNTEYTISYKLHEFANQKNEYIIVKDFDFHMLDKDNFKDIING